jgi:hypothetical protein
MKEVGEAAEAIDRAAEDQRFDLQEIRRCKREVADIASICHKLLAGLDATIDCAQEETR